MSNYDIKYEMVDYDLFYKRIDDLCHNGKNKVTFIREMPIGKSRCGFPIEHLKVGKGPIKITYAAGLRGDEIAGVSFIFSLMENIAKGLGEYKDFDPAVYTIDFLPCLNPEGYFTTTYAIDSATEGYSRYEFEQFSREYEAACLIDDKNVFAVEKCLKNAFISSKMKGNVGEFISMFWRLYRSKDISFKDIVDYLSINTGIPDVEGFVLDELSKWNLDDNFVLSSTKYHNKLFSNVTLDCIPLLDSKHVALHTMLERLYDGKKDFCSLANFGANSSGVNLSNNNSEMFSKYKENNKDVFGYGKFNDVCLSLPGSYGVPSRGDRFLKESETRALESFCSNKGDMFIYCSGTGNAIYSLPKDYSTVDESSKELREFTNKSMIDSYLSRVRRSEGFIVDYGIYPKLVIGVRKLINDNYDFFHILQFGKGSDPLGFHFNQEMYKKYVKAYLDGNSELISSLLDYYRVNSMTSDEKNYKV